MQPGEVIADRWEVLAALGQGGWGDVYRARHRISQRLAALKILKGRGGYAPETVVRFEREASAAARIGHPGIVEVLDAGVDKQRGLLFIAMELLEGETLRARMGSDALGWIAALLEPLAAAHARGFVHRDLKPENVFIERQGAQTRVRLLDFGLVRVAEDVRATEPGEAMGTPWYMAPEQAMSAHDVSPSADVWAVGVMLYEAVTGDRPYSQPSLTLHLIEIRTGHHVPLSIRAPGTPPGLAHLVERCLDKDPARRPQSAAVLLSELRALGIHPPRPDQAAVSSTLPAQPGLVTPAAAPRTSPIPATSGPRPAAFHSHGSASHASASHASASHASPAMATTAAPRRSRGCLIAAMVGLLSVAALGSAAAVWVVLRQEPTHEIQGAGIAVEIPDAWQPMALTFPNALYQYEEPVDPAVGGVPVRFFVARAPFVGTADQYADLALQSSADGGMRIERNAPATLAGVDGREVETSADHADGTFGQVQRVIVTHGRAWTVGCSGPWSGFDEVRERCHRVMGSFRFTDS